MGATQKYALPYPEQSDPPDGPAQIKALADKLDPLILTPSVVDAKGDLLVGTAADVLARLPVGTDGNVLTADSAQVAGLRWAPAGGGGASGELAYAQATAIVNVTATTEAAANTLVTAPAVTFDGSTIAFVEFFSEGAGPPAAASGALTFWLYQDGASIGAVGVVVSPAAAALRVPIYVRRRLTPAAGSRTFSMRVSASAASGAVVLAGAGGAGGDAPMFIRVVRA